MNRARERELLRAEAKLLALQMGGVLEWENYEASIKRFHGKLQHEADITALIYGISHILKLGFSGKVTTEIKVLMDKYGVQFKDPQ